MRVCWGEGLKFGWRGDRIGEQQIPECLENAFTDISRKQISLLIFDRKIYYKHWKNVQKPTNVCFKNESEKFVKLIQISVWNIIHLTVVDNQKKSAF